MTFPNLSMLIMSNNVCVTVTTASEQRMNESPLLKLYNKWIILHEDPQLEGCLSGRVSQLRPKKYKYANCSMA